MNVDIKLSICIPVYNNYELFRNCLNLAAQTSENNRKIVEIIVQDNHSDENIYNIVSKLRNTYKSINIKYFRNERNIGLANNFIKAVENSVGEYCWIIGADDFVLPNSVDKIVDVILNNKEIDFISLGFSTIYLNNLRSLYSNGDGQNFFDVNIILSESSYKKSNSTSGRLLFQQTLNPEINHTFHGSMMTCVFKKKIWDMFEITENISNEQFDSLASIYPHQYIFLKTMFNRNAYFLNENMISTGKGRRSWIDNSQISEILYIMYFKVNLELISLLKAENYPKKQIRIVRNFIGYSVGSKAAHFLGHYFINFKKYNYDLSKMMLFFILYYSFNIHFYRGLISSCIFNSKKLIKKMF